MNTSTRPATCIVRLRRFLVPAGLQQRFRLVMALALVLFCALAAGVTYYSERRSLEAHTFQQAELVMATVGATRKYIQEDMRPRLLAVMAPEQFVLEAMSSSYIARKVMEYFGEENPNFRYRRVSINARNPEFEATALERRIIKYFRDHPASTDWRDIVRLEEGRYFMHFRPVTYSASCLYCHGEPATAPSTILDLYGDSGGFHKPLDVPAGLVGVAIPAEKGMARIQETAFFLFGGAIMLALLLYSIFTFCFKRLIVNNLRQMLAGFRGSLVDEEGRQLLEQTRQIDEIDELNNAARLIAAQMAQSQQHLRERARNLEEKATLEKQLHQAQKLESVGRLAGGVAHDFNNMLQGVIGFCDIMAAEMAPDDPQLENLRAIRQAGLRSAALTRQLLAFASRQPAIPKVIDLNETVGSMLRMLQRLIGEDITLEWKRGEEIWPVRIDPSQVDQMLANLVINARDAINGPGRITLTSKNVSLDATYCAATAGTKPGDYVLLTVSDDGCGMDAKTLAQIFEPFFTTKEQGKGTGLGLATVYGIVRQNHGCINVYSEPGQGTVFRLYLPRSRESAGPEPIKTNSALPGGQETILLVEDEKAILTMAETILTRLGYRVFSAAHPSEALQIAGEQPEIDLLLTDLVLPEMYGHLLAAQLQTQRPELRCLYMSGYLSATVADQVKLDLEQVNFIQKPFSMEELAAKVRTALTR
ncbi:c-type heme family protein [Desulfurivibrio alkaliphilus]|uniref:histidine kinase n=1 Tax=Desulfurivibrio alkaliphilus (strain DSM 19089 / UNIQEM U267 / AHT2) TaxID=589865 RepID=D6Z1M6_DESAT|nr:DUF3365 domain-containing protein [Desulfurivibrio alkaliphilus]ADH85451.1 integral membrane sensor hybrid histidine kinase [Desulfurivibrio alkaliphilus AHT 2]